MTTVALIKHPIFEANDAANRVMEEKKKKRTATTYAAVLSKCKETKKCEWRRVSCDRQLIVACCEKSNRGKQTSKQKKKKKEDDGMSAKKVSYLAALGDAATRTGLEERGEEAAAAAIGDGVSSIACWSLSARSTMSAISLSTSLIAASTLASDAGASVTTA